MHEELLLETLNEASAEDPDIAELSFWEKEELLVHSEATLKRRRALRRDVQVLEMLEAHWQAASRTVLWHRGVLPARPAPPGCSTDMWRPTGVVLARRQSIAEEMRQRGAVQTTRLTKTEYLQARPNPATATPHARRSSRAPPVDGARLRRRPVRRRPCGLRGPQASLRC